MLKRNHIVLLHCTGPRQMCFLRGRNDNMSHGGSSQQYCLSECSYTRNRDSCARRVAYALDLDQHCSAAPLVRAPDLIGIDPASRPMKRLEAESGRAGQRQRPGCNELGRSQHQDNHPDAHLALSVRDEEPDVNHRGQNNRHGHAEQNPYQNGHFQPPLVWVEYSSVCPPDTAPHFAGLLRIRLRSAVPWSGLAEFFLGRSLNLFGRFTEHSASLLGARPTIMGGDA